MIRTRTARSLVAVLAITMVAASCGNRSDDNKSSSGNGSGSGNGSSQIDTSNCPDNATAGIDGDTITLASSFPQSGLTAAFSQISKGYKAYFAKVNAEGGVPVAGKKYQIKVVDKDDEYTASKTANNINDLVGPNGDKAFATFNVVGTAGNVAVRDDLAANCVPNVFAASGAPTMGDPDHPWTIGSTLAVHARDQVVRRLPEEEQAQGQGGHAPAGRRLRSGLQGGLHPGHQGHGHHAEADEDLRARR